MIAKQWGMSFLSCLKSSLVKAAHPSCKPCLFWGAARSAGSVLIWGWICPLGGASIQVQVPKEGASPSTPAQQCSPYTGAEPTADPCIPTAHPCIPTTHPCVPKVQAWFVEHKMPGGLQGQTPC